MPTLGPQHRLDVVILLLRHVEPPHAENDPVTLADIEVGDELNEVAYLQRRPLRGRCDWPWRRRWSGSGVPDERTRQPELVLTGCTYAIWWVQVKYRWRLSMDSAERNKLAGILSGTCRSRSVSIPTRAR